jgi:hypothetical protein
LPGFLHGSNFLLPWDITVKAEKDKWPSIGETTTSRKGRQKKSNKGTQTLPNYRSLKDKTPPTENIQHKNLLLDPSAL